MTGTSEPRCRIAVLVSGSGSNLQSFIDQEREGKLPADLVQVVSNRPGVRALARAESAGIATRCIDHKHYETRQAFEEALVESLRPAAPDLIVLAGFMRILSPWFVECYAGRILNIHPALLPKYPGLDTHARALAAGDRHHGSTVHFVTEELDGGPRILAARLPIVEGDTPESLQQRVQAAEHRIYPQVARWFAEGRLAYRERAAWLDNQRLDEPRVRDFD